MNAYKNLDLLPGKAICYSGFRDGQRPGLKYPNYEQVREDLLLLHKHWRYIRLFDCDLHAEIVLDVIRNEDLQFQVMLGAYIEAEVNNFNCPWDGGIHPKNVLEQNAKNNSNKMFKLAELANRYSDIIFSLSVGNEASVDWTDHLVPTERLIKYVRDVRERANQPITFCENYVPWLSKLNTLAHELDFISIHTYPVWEYKNIYEALDYTKENYWSVASRYPEKPVVITEAGWATKSNGKGILRENVNEEYQKIYFEKLMDWAEKENILTFFFEAFDETWKGSPEPLEPEKHWGVFKIDRSPKLVIKNATI